MRTEALRLVHDIRDRATATVASHSQTPDTARGERVSVSPSRLAAAL
jgi:hypothetical protein